MYLQDSVSSNSQSISGCSVFLCSHSIQLHVKFSILLDDNLLPVFMCFIDWLRRCNSCNS